MTGITIPFISFLSPSSKIFETSVYTIDIVPLRPLALSAEQKSRPLIPFLNPQYPTRVLRRPLDYTGFISPANFRKSIASGGDSGRPSLATRLEFGSKTSVFS